MKGISTVVATLLMLIITIALAGLAYTYMTAIMAGKTAVVLVIADTKCNSTSATVWVRNDGTTSCATVTVDIEGTTCTISDLGSGEVDSCSPATITLTPGYHDIRVVGCGSTAEGYCYVA